MSLGSSRQSPKPRESLTPLQERFIRVGFEGFTALEIVELLLSLALPCNKHKTLAGKCVEHFQNLRGLLSASTEELKQAGLPPHCVCSIRLLRELPAEILKERIMEQPVHHSSQEFFDYLCYSMRDLKKEVFKVTYLNNRSQIIDAEDLFFGTLDSILIHPREIIDSAIKHNATCLLFSHNHPAGDPAPSKSDKQITRDLVFMGMILGIKVLDHIIIGNNVYFSFADEGLIEKYEDNFLNLKIRGILDTKRDYHKGLYKTSALCQNR